MSWSKNKQGYATLNRLYGLSNLKRNRFAFMAFVEQDQPAAQQALQEIGQHWDRVVWGSSAKFEEVRAWAAGRPSPPAIASENAN
jgi:hypothetical protein